MVPVPEASPQTSSGRWVSGKRGEFSAGMKSSDMQSESLGIRFYRQTSGRGLRCVQNIFWDFSTL